MLASAVSQSNVADQFRPFLPFRKSLASAISKSRWKSSTVYHGSQSGTDCPLSLPQTSSPGGDTTRKRNCIILESWRSVRQRAPAFLLLRQQYSFPFRFCFCLCLYNVSLICIPTCTPSCVLFCTPICVLTCVLFAIVILYLVAFVAFS